VEVELLLQRHTMKIQVVKDQIQYFQLLHQLVVEAVVPEILQVGQDMVANLVVQVVEEVKQTVHHILLMSVQVIHLLLVHLKEQMVVTVL